MEGSAEPHTADAAWLILTPSVDSKGWWDAIRAAASEAKWTVISDLGAPHMDEGSQRLIVTDDAHQALAAGASRIAAIVAEPESAPDAVAEQHDTAFQDSRLQASLLLARALSLGPDHRVVTAAELAARPAEILLFEALKLTPPISRAEFSKDPTTTAAFALYRNLPAERAVEVQWLEPLFSYCPKASQNWSSMAVMDITGRPRMMVHGPYLSMPVGRWQACIRFGVDQDAAKHQLRLDWGTRTETVSEYVTPGKAGIYELNLEFDWTYVEVSEVRLILTEGSFMGTLFFYGVTITKISSETATESLDAA